VQPSQDPSSSPSTEPSKIPSVSPSLSPSISPSETPSMEPSQDPTTQPSMEPSKIPSDVPSSSPSMQPSANPSGQPSKVPSMNPSATPSMQPSQDPSNQPSMEPSRIPSDVPSSSPSMQPSANPSGQPSKVPSMNPSASPSMQPSVNPSGQPSKVPSMNPSATPSMQPSQDPSNQPSMEPSKIPSDVPSSFPSMQPSVNPSGQPSKVPSMQPSDVPSNQPSGQPSMNPSMLPSMAPSLNPSLSPSMVPSKIPSSSPSGVPSVSMEPSQNPSLQPSYDPDNKSNVGGLVVDILGQSGKMNLQNNNRTVQITMDALREVDANGNTVGNTGSKKHSINSFASQQFIFGIRDYYTTLFTFNSTTNETVPEAANGLRVDFSSTLHEDDEQPRSRLKVQALLVSQGGIAGDAQGNWTVSPGDFKWNIWFEDWLWHSSAAFVELDIEVKGANAAPTQSNGDLTYDLGDDATLDLRSDYELSDGTSVSMPDGYPRVTTQGSKTIFTFKFARNEGVDIKYDPLISFAAITEAPSSFPSKEPSTSTSVPSMQPTPVSYRACRTKKANKNRKLCLKITGCFWKNKKCHPKTPSPTAAPTISVEPTVPPPSATPTISVEPTTAGTPDSWRSCRTKKANKKRKVCRNNQCRHVDSF
jgi:hypothetical protein